MERNIPGTKPRKPVTAKPNAKGFITENPSKNNLLSMCRVRGITGEPAEKLVDYFTERRAKINKTQYNALPSFDEYVITLQNILYLKSQGQIMTMNNLAEFMAKKLPRRLSTSFIRDLIIGSEINYGKIGKRKYSKHKEGMPRKATKPERIKQEPAARKKTPAELLAEINQRIKRENREKNTQKKPKKPERKLTLKMFINDLFSQRKGPLEIRDAIIAKFGRGTVDKFVFIKAGKKYKGYQAIQEWHHEKMLDKGLF